MLVETYALRLGPGEDLRQGLAMFAQAHQLPAAAILTAVGSLRQAALRFAGADAATVVPGPVEVVSLGGTLSVQGLHVHGAIATANGTTYGGHLMPGCIVYTTAEIVIAQLPQYQFQRALDPETGYRELQILPRSPADSGESEPR